jgi:hypothetical protein
MNRSTWLLMSFAGCVLLESIIAAQAGGSPTRSQTPQQRPATPPAAPTRSAASSSFKIEGNLLQVMRGIVYPASNVVFAGQSDLSEIPKVKDPAVSPNPLNNTYGGWQAIENASIAVAESANLLLVPGRTCGNGKPVPVQRADWVKYVDGLRSAGMAAYKAAQSKSQDAMVDASGTVADACSACHDVYREKKNGAADRCLP